MALWINSSNVNKQYNILLKMLNSRYSRLTTLPEIGPERIEFLNNAHVLIIGCGALGSLCSMYLAASGVGNITIADFDTIDISNLQRQLFFSEADLGNHKSTVLAERMRALNSEIDINVFPQLINKEKAFQLFPKYDVIIDGSDNPDTKMMTDAISYDVKKPAVIAGVRGYEGQVMTCLPNSARFSDVFGNDISCNGFLPCSISGVVGPAAGVAASIQATEAIKLITKNGDVLADRVLFFNLLNMEFNVLSL